jgi:hypothetical protein
VSTPNAITPATSSANQGGKFNLDNGTYSYHLNLVDSAGNPLKAGSYIFYYTIAGDPVRHSFVFEVK